MDYYDKYLKYKNKYLHLKGLGLENQKKNPKFKPTIIIPQRNFQNTLIRNHDKFIYNKKADEDKLNFNIELNDLLMQKVFNKLKQKNIKSINFDFDNTILKIHAKGFEEVKNDNFADYELFKMIIKYAKQNDIIINIITFNDEYNLDKYLKQFEGNINYYPLNFGIQKKGDELLNIMDSYKDNNKDSYIFIDDDKSNIINVSNKGFNKYFWIEDKNKGFNKEMFIRMLYRLFDIKIEDL